MIYIVLILAVLIGAGIVLFIKPSNGFIQFLLAFSGAYLLSITVLHLLPEAFSENERHTRIGVFILTGILIQSVLEYFSKGAEHGHVHIHKPIKSIPWLLFLSLGIHAIFEGIPLGTDENKVLLWAIFIHKIPIAIILTTFLLQTKLHKTVIIILLILFSLMSPMGCFLFENIPFLNTYNTEITALIIGIFLHISSIILFESDNNHNFSIRKFLAIILGFGIAFLSIH
jgi:zinc transporter ZupT